MFNFSGSEIVFILLLALIILGPEKLPEAMRRFGQTYNEIKKISTGFQTEIKQAFDEPMREMQATADELRRAASFPMDTEPPKATTPPPPKPAVAPAPVPASPPEAADPDTAAEPVPGTAAEPAPAAVEPETSSGVPTDGASAPPDPAVTDDADDTDGAVGPDEGSGTPT